MIYEWERQFSMITIVDFKPACTITLMVLTALSTLDTVNVT
jgi:hypothetical protein